MTLPWLDQPTGPGWYWFRVNPSTTMRGPCLVRRDVVTDQLIVEGGDGIFPRGKPCAHFQRSWAGPLPVPEDWHDELQELRERDYRQSKQQRRRKKS